MKVIGQLRRFAVFIVLLLSALNSAWAESISGESTSVLERVVWRKTPITISLQVGEERLIHFPGAVSIGLPAPLTSALRAQSIDGTLYLRALQPFTENRLMVKPEEGGPMVVLDVSATQGSGERSSLADVQVMMPPSTAQETGDDPTSIRAETEAWGYVALTRFAAQQLYAPSRLVPNELGIAQVSVEDTPVPLIRGVPVTATPAAAWKAGRYWVTAVKLQNDSPEPVVLDPRDIRGRWLTATFQHNRLLPAGSEADTTTVYLISNRSFIESL
ncbi:TIGR03749 family integrating conjugative element protein [Pseudomaricurvus alkylphenolicus]|uniref:TIGR03749 family integrating conjugative element protein n=1 Tax=Pseudomaricurvus alkylphenolicus TaxID=1306991 RepID=UPI0014212742|nr:TIGR03749 family integrating conjugative element protein [Pseudomaricurvus alkylphenolicus]NIB44050.1 TIGR03749 family integrating conjugative element protein [Pseudomaricurvus alkylphenolicus]